MNQSLQYMYGLVLEPHWSMFKYFHHRYHSLYFDSPITDTPATTVPYDSSGSVFALHHALSYSELH